MSTAVQKKKSPQGHVYESLLGLLADGASPAQERLPSLMQMAKQFGVGVTAVRQAVNKLETQGYLITRQGSGIYPTGRTTRTLRIGLFGRIHGHLWEDITNELIHTFGADPEIVLSMIPLYENETAESELARIRHRLLTDHLDVLLAVDTRQVIEHQQVLHELQSQIKIIDLYKRSASVVPGNLPRGSVVSDQNSGHRLAIEHLIDSGCRKILLLSHGSGGHSEEACRQAAMASRHAVSIYIHQGSPNTQQDYASDVINLLARHKEIDGIHGFSDFRIAKVAPALRAAGYQIPKDLKLIGYGDTAWSELMDVPLSTINTRPDQFATIAYDMVRRGDLTQHHSVKPRLVVRQSTHNDPR